MKYPSADFMKAFNKNIVEEFRANDGKVSGQFADANLLLLTTTGAKSGQPRLAPLAYFTVDGKLIIIGSKAGADTNPDWVHNLRANPQAHIEVGTDAYDVTSRELPTGRAGRDLRQGRRRGTGFRRIPVEDLPRHPAVRTAEELARRSRAADGTTTGPGWPSVRGRHRAKLPPPPKLPPPWSRVVPLWGRDGTMSLTVPFGSPRASEVLSIPVVTLH